MLGIRRSRKVAGVRTLLTLLIGVALPSGFLPAPPFAPRPAHANEGTEPETPDPPPGDLPLSERFPLQAVQPSEGLENPQAEVPFHFPPGLSPEKAVSDLTRLPLSSGPNFDMFAAGADGGAHVALVYARDVNEQASDGTWLPESSGLAAEGGGWNATVSGDVRIRLPNGLAQAQPVVVEFPEGRLESVPAGLSTTIPGQAVGARVLYPAAFPSSDLSYEIGEESVDEVVTLKNKNQLPQLSWDVKATGVSLERSTLGEIRVLSGSDVLGRLPAPSAVDSAPHPASSAGVYSLQNLGSGRYALSVTLDQSFLQKAKYPVSVGLRHAFPAGEEHDTYGATAAPGASFEGSRELRVGDGDQAFVRFDLSGLTGQGITIHQAVLGLEAAHRSGAPKIDVRNVASPWPASGDFTFGTKPSVEEAVVSSVALGGDAQVNIDLTSAYQQRFHSGSNDLGVMLSSSSAGRATFSSSEAEAKAVVLAVVLNHLPDPPQLRYPDQNDTIQNPSPTLRVQGMPDDPDGDKVYVRFQVTETNSDFSVGNMTFQSGWLDEPRVTVPAGELNDGERYKWRAQSWDLIKLKFSDGNEQPQSATRDFTLALRHFGDDERFAMWSQELGNDMVVKVNEANGNLYISAPLDTLSTPVEDLKLGIAYNSQLDEGFGLGRGFDIYAGPASSHRELPVELQRLQPFPESGVKITMRDGSELFFGHRDRNIFTGPGTVREQRNGGFVFTSPEGGTYIFEENGQHRALEKARPAWAAAKSSNDIGTSFDYGFDDQNRLQSLHDPLERDINFCWEDKPCSTGDLLRITAWDGRQWFVNSVPAGGGGSVLEIENPAGETVAFHRGANGFVNLIQDGEQFANSVDGWVISYAQDALWPEVPNDRKNEHVRVEDVLPPAAGATATDPVHPWHFEYIGVGAPHFSGTSAMTTKITDPRGPLTPAQDDDFQTIVDFNVGGYPVRIMGPADEDGKWPVKRYVFDTNNNLVCERTAAAQAIRAVNNQQCLNDEHSAVYTYEKREPHLMTSQTNPSAGRGANPGPRLRTEYRYDEGFSGLWTEFYDTVDMGGLSVHEEMLEQELDKGYGNGPPEISGGNWSLRLSGHLETKGKEREFKFRLFSQDGASLSIGSKNLVDCFGEQRTNQQFAFANCGQNDDKPVVTKTLAPGEQHPITIELSAVQQGSTRFRLEWDQGRGKWETVPRNVLSPNRGLLTKKVVGAAGTGGNAFNPRMRIDYEYGRLQVIRNDLMARSLPKTETMVDTTNAGAADPRTTTYDYDQFGRVTRKELQPAPEARVFTYGYRDTKLHDRVSCMDQMVDPVGAVTDYVCSSAGDVLQSTVNVDEVTYPGQGVVQEEQHRKTTACFDELGRTTAVDPPGPTLTANTYDLAGRLIRIDQVIEGSVQFVDGEEQRIDCARLEEVGADQAIDEIASTPDPQDPISPDVATTENVYDSAGRLVTEIQADPDESGPETSPVVQHVHDWAGNEVERVDPRGESWLMRYDAFNRVTQTQTGAGLTTNTRYRLFGDDGEYLNRTVVTDPALVESRTNFDVIGRELSESVGSLTPTLYEYDVAGNVLKTTRVVGQSDAQFPTDAEPDIVTESRYNGFDQVTRQIEPFLDPPRTRIDAITGYAYDAAGRLSQVDGPRLPADADDRVLYEYDAADRMTFVQQPGLGVANGTAVTYDQAGERVVTETAMSPTESVVRVSSFDENGRVVSETDAGGTTENSYNAAGWLADSELPNGYRLSYGYDMLGRQVARDFRGNGFPTGRLGCRECFSLMEYDETGNMTHVERDGIFLDLEYDADGRLVETTQATSGGVPGTLDVTSYDYQPDVGDDTGQLRAVDSAAGHMEYSYNPDGLLSSITDPFTGEETAYQYDSAGRPELRTDPAGLSWQRAYEPQTGRVASQTITQGAAELADFELSYDRAGNVTNRIEKVDSPTSGQADGSGQWSYEYDGGNRLRFATDPDQGITEYQYDQAGNRTLVDEPDEAPVSTDYDAQGLPVSSSDGTTYTHDELGNLTSIDSPDDSEDRCYFYDGFSNLFTSSDGEAIGCARTTGDDRYEYDGLDRVFQKKIPQMPATGELFFYEGTTENLTKTEEVAGSGETLLAQGPNGPLAQETDGDTRFFLKDLHGDVVGLASENPGVTGSGLYDPYGDPIEKEGERTVLGFQGDYTDSDTGLVDMGARDYAPGLGRFTSMDPLAGSTSEPDTLNRFGYAETNPITYFDPTGLHSHGVGHGNPCAGLSGEARKECMGVPTDGGGGGNGDPQSGSVVAPDPKWGGAKRSLALSLSDFDEMTVRQRLKWLEWFATRYSYYTDEWLKAIEGVLTGFEGERFLRAGRSWASAVDASILMHLQDGMRLATGRTLRGGGDEGSRRWQQLFEGVAQNESPSELRRLWGRAEIASTQFGVQAARAWGRTPRNADIALFTTSEAFRQSLATGHTSPFVFGDPNPRVKSVTAWATKKILNERPYTLEEARVLVPVAVAYDYDRLVLEGVLP